MKTPRQKIHPTRQTILVSRRPLPSIDIKVTTELSADLDCPLRRNRRHRPCEVENDVLGWKVDQSNLGDGKLVEFETVQATVCNPGIRGRCILCRWLSRLDRFNYSVTGLGRQRRRRVARSKRLLELETGLGSSRLFFWWLRNLSCSPEKTPNKVRQVDEGCLRDVRLDSRTCCDSRGTEGSHFLVVAKDRL